MITLLFFARIRDAAGTSQADVDASTAGEALKIAAERFGGEFSRVLAICSIVVDGEPVTKDRLWDVALRPDAEIAVLPPVSGGQEVPVVPDPELMPSAETGARMVDVGDKAETQREATAVCTLVAEPATRDALLAGRVPKGDAAGTARIAGILAAKRVPELIPLCHPLRITSIDVSIEQANDGIEVRASVRGRDRTGFEMEALTACAVAALTLYDMGKSEDPRMRVEGLRLVAKSGGKSGSVTYE